jgi:photosystem II stability/assembly factor-like uncharacterized protein
MRASQKFSIVSFARSVAGLRRHQVSARGRQILILTVLGCAAALLASSASVASATGISGIPSDWVQQTLPGGYSIGGPLPADPMAPVSCVAGTTFCAVIASDSANPPAGGGEDPQAVLVTDNGTNWTTSGDLPAGPQYVAISCPTTSVCYVAGGGGTNGTVMITTDGGQTWTPTPETPAGPNSIDCVSATTCWVTYNDGETGTAYTINSGKTWTGSYETGGPGLNDISCWNGGGSCVAVGGTNNENGGDATVLTGPVGSWQPSTSPVLNEISTLFSISCVPTTLAETCYAVGASDNSAGTEGGPVELVSTDGGQTWSATEFVDDDGWLNSISCTDASDCWAAGGGTALALAGTDDGGGTWYPDTVADTDELNNVSCASVDFCVATADNALWVTTDDGGIASEPAPSPGIAQPMPLVTAASVTRAAGAALTVTGQDRQVNTGTSVAAEIRLPDGHVLHSTLRTGKFFFYVWKVSSLPIGSTSVQFSVAGKKVDQVTILAKETAKAVRPKITSPNHATFRVGIRSSFSVSESGSPRPLVWETGKLPKGVSFNPATGHLSGTPARRSSGTYRITFTASNGAKPDAVQHFRLSIRK